MRPGLPTIFRKLGIAFLILLCVQKASSSPFPEFESRSGFYLPQDTSRPVVHDRYGDPYSYPNRSPFYLQDTAFIKRNIEYDPVTKQYYIVEKIGDRYYRTPTAFSMQEFLQMKGRED